MTDAIEQCPYCGEHEVRSILFGGVQVILCQSVPAREMYLTSAHRREQARQEIPALRRQAEHGIKVLKARLDRLNGQD